MTKFLPYLLVITAAIASSQLRASPVMAFIQCPVIANDVARLACFDSYANIATEVPMPNLSDDGSASKSGAGPVNGRPREGLSSHEPNKMLRFP